MRRSLFQRRSRFSKMLPPFGSIPTSEAQTPKRVACSARVI
jgi:hypothetical protein